MALEHEIPATRTLSVADARSDRGKKVGGFSVGTVAFSDMEVMLKVAENGEAFVLISQNNDPRAVVRGLRADEPIPMILTCPKCGKRHIDEGEFGSKPHSTHACQHCGLAWKPATVPTKGVMFLPGYKNKEPPPDL